MEQQDLLISIDLGTSKSAVMTAAGLRYATPSQIGYPQDLIGVRLLGDTYAVGEAVEGKNYLEIVRPIEQGLMKTASELELDASRKLLDHLRQQVISKEGGRICAVIGVPASASQVNRDRLLGLAKEFFDVTLLVSSPFLVGYAAEKLANSIVIDIGAGTVDICALKGRLPEQGDQNSLLKAGNYIDAMLKEAITLRYPQVQLNDKVVRRIKEQYAFVGSGTPPRKAVVTLREAGRPTVVDVTQEVRQACESIVAEIIEQTEKLIATFDPNDQADAVANILLAGGGSQIAGLDQMIIAGLQGYGEVAIQKIAEVVYTSCEGGIKLASELPPDFWDQMGDVAVR